MCQTLLVLVTVYGLLAVFSSLSYQSPVRVWGWCPCPNQPNLINFCKGLNPLWQGGKDWACFILDNASRCIDEVARDMV